MIPSVTRSVIITINERKLFIKIFKYLSIVAKVHLKRRKTYLFEVDLNVSYDDDAFCYVE